MKGIPLTTQPNAARLAYMANNYEELAQKIEDGMLSLWNNGIKLDRLRADIKSLEQIQLTTINALLELGVSQNEIAKAAGISRTRVGQLNYRRLARGDD